MARTAAEMIDPLGNAVALVTAVIHGDEAAQTSIIFSLSRLQLFRCLAVSIEMLANFVAQFAEEEGIDIDTVLHTWGVAAAKGGLP